MGFPGVKLPVIFRAVTIVTASWWLGKPTLLFLRVSKHFSNLQDSWSSTMMIRNNFRVIWEIMVPKAPFFWLLFVSFFWGGEEGTWRFHPISFKVHLVKITPGFFSHEKAIWKGMYWDLLYNYLYTNWDDPPRRGAWFKGVPWWIGVFGYWTLSMLFPRVEGTSNLHFKGIWINFDWISYSINHVC